MAGFNPMEEMLKKVYFRMQFKEKYPQCADCRFVDELIFSREYYYNYMEEEMCLKCRKYKGGEING